MKGKFLKAVDLLAATLLPGKAALQGDLTVFAFHSVLDHIGEIENHAIDPYQPLTVADVDWLISRLKEGGAAFVTGTRVIKGNLPPYAVWLTFDDGYANNLRLLPVLERHGVPATIFVATANTLSGESFWWDVFHRESRNAGIPPADAIARREYLKTLPPAKIRSVIADAFGSAAFRAVGETDRPMTASEVAMIARHPLIEIGNHTHSHAILTVVDPQTQFEEIRRCQLELERVTGRRPQAIAYPNGNFSAETVVSATKAGIDAGVTCLPSRTRLGTIGDPETRMTIGRFASLRHARMDRELVLATARTGLAMRQARDERARLLSASATNRH